ncbi:GNAT family N-acetyltransferase [Anaerocolumna sedimenticola]|uniref:GNAT family N-acetyltransferase n=1 Tax=Anaerocolumna sedimenticola TaxID=2696063 RepID=A0A6P1TPR8_9FIRM|nr:GNAT family N-acetyltransferase [Anaerocolumna sedimenticola]QHQ62974.1 GNAT family N-acetyltransferase [Anaerocolumna sedimenticola]
MNIKAITSIDYEWTKVIDYAENCSWRAGKTLANKMKNKHFTEWERVFIAIEGNEIAAYCTVAKTDCIPNVPYTPYISFMFVGEKYRGNRISQKLIKEAMAYVKDLGFEKVYLVSDHDNLYEKYGFSVVDRRIASWGAEEKIYMQCLS